MSLLHPSLFLRRVTELTPERLAQLGVRALVLDVDNTLTTHDNPHPDPDIQAWLEEQRRAGLPMMILSNNSRERVLPFAKILRLPFVADGRKPLGRGFREAADRLGLSPRQIGVVGDQIFTDILGGNLFGSVTVLVQPLGPETLRFIRFKRRLEALVLRGYHKKQRRMLR